MSQQIIEKWLEEMSASVEQHDLTAHMNLISLHVHVYGLPSGRVINYQQWKKRRQNEFGSKQLLALEYTLLKIKTIALRRLIFQVNENMQDINHVCITINKDIILELEQDNCWRVVEEKIHNWKVEQS